jgi:hypothetical protein
MKGFGKGAIIPFIIMFVALLCLFFYVQGKKDTNAQLNERITSLVDEVKGIRDQKAADDAEHVKTEAALEFEREMRIKSETKVGELEAANVKLLSDNKLYREQLKAWSDNALASEMGKRIGEHEVIAELRGLWHFSLTRLGGENTLSIFKDAETNFTLAENRRLELVEKDSQIGSLNVSVELQKAETKRESDGRIKALKELDNAVEIISDQKKELRRKQLEQFLKGTAIGIIIVELIHLIAK